MLDNLKNNLSEGTIHQILIQETDHFLQAELGHDQRASWILALCSGILFTVASYIISIKKGDINDFNIIWLQLSMLFLSVAILIIVLALWPLAGKKGKFWRLSHKVSGTNERKQFSMEWYWEHYTSHRLRAKKKANLIVWGMSCFLIGFLFAILGIISCSL